MIIIEKPFNTIYVADLPFIDDLCEELGEVSAVIGNLVFSPIQKMDVVFALDIWINPKLVEFESISQAVRILRSEGKYWFMNPIENIRRARLIEAELRKLPVLIHHFPLIEEIPAIGCFSLLDKNTLIYSPQRWKKAPLGDYQFIEDRENPPNRAYLKLWEALSLWGQYPVTGETAIDLGASPGGWTYVMSMLGTNVTGVDKAELDPAIARRSSVSFLKQSAFALDPSTFKNPIDWVLCDIACYPERTYDLIQQWIKSGKAKNMIFTIKLQGKTDFEILNKLQAIPGSRVIHLFHNKHEATFFYPAPLHLFPTFN